jgi:glycosyltransferase involved in cell wall biosynthesis
MKVFIFGPFITNNSANGVATFNTSLMNSYLSLNHDVIIFTQNVFMSNHPKLKIIKLYRFFPLVNFLKINIYILLNKPNIIISSLQYSIYLIFVNRKIKIHVLHGFLTHLDYSFLKKIGFLIMNKIISLSFSFIVANSFFTATVNTNVFGIKVNKIIRLGLSDSIISHLNNSEKSNSINRANTILFVGRFVNSKRVDLIIKSLEVLYNNFTKDFTFLIIGNGPLENKILKQLSNCNFNYTLKGSVHHSDLPYEYLSAKVFISLNDMEPFGLTFLEAYALGLNIVAPISGGQNEIFDNRDINVEFVSTINTLDIATKLNRLLNIDNKLRPYLQKTFSYNQVATDLIKLLVTNTLESKNDR